MILAKLVPVGYKVDSEGNISVVVQDKQEKIRCVK